MNATIELSAGGPLIHTKGRIHGSHQRATTRFSGLRSYRRQSSRDGRRTRFGKLEKPSAEASKSPRSDCDRAVVNLGNPLAGLLLGALMIAGTMAGFFVWDNYQGGADAKTTVQIGQN